MKEKVLIFGASGQLGQDIARVFSHTFTVFTPTHLEADIVDYSSVAQAVEKFTPDLVINCSAYMRVEDAEREIEKSYQVNTFGPAYVGMVASDKQIPFIHISTDYVFDGTNKDGYLEGDETCPLNVYGASKDAGEKLVRMKTAQHWIIRTSALFGDGKTSFVKRMLEKASRGEDIGVVDDQWTVPTSTYDLAEALFKLVEKKLPFGTYHLVSEGSASWYELTEAIKRISGMPMSIHVVKTQTGGAGAKRPVFSVLKNQAAKAHGVVLPNWETALTRYLNEQHNHDK